jgi:hypothetical protein
VTELFCLITDLLKEIRMPKQKQVRISLSERDADYLAKIAKQMNIKESDVMKKGLQLMALYAKTKSEDGDGELIFRTSDGEENDKEIMII